MNINDKKKIQPRSYKALKSTVEYLLYSLILVPVSPFLFGLLIYLFIGDPGSEKSERYRKEVLTSTNIIKSDSNNIIAYGRRAKAKAGLGDYFGAIEDLSKVIELNPNDIDAYMKRGKTKSELNDYIGAIQDYDKVIELNPDYPRAYYGRGISKIQLQQMESGCADLSKALGWGIAGVSEAIKEYCN